MANDHYVAQTYLKHFGDIASGGMLHAYRKSDGTAFSCWPKDVCHEWDGDLDPGHGVDPTLLGQYRKIFESTWNPAVGNILAGENISYRDKFNVSGYLANLMVSVPAWQRVGIEMSNLMTLGTLTFSMQMKEKNGKADQMLSEGIEMLKNGELKLETDPSYVKGLTTKRLFQYALLTYNQNWQIIKNTTEHPFVTSDNPVAFDYSGKIGDPLIRYLPVTPYICLRVGPFGFSDQPNIDLDAIIKGMQLPPKGTIVRVKASPHLAKMINRLVTQCAESLVFSPQKSAAISALTRKYSKYRVEPEFVELPTGEENSIYQGVIIRVRESKSN